MNDDDGDVGKDLFYHVFEIKDTKTKHENDKGLVW